MNQLANETALRIALAGRALPGVEIQYLLAVLHDCLGTPITKERLSRITVSDLKKGLMAASEKGAKVSSDTSSLKEAVQILWGKDSAEKLPPIDEPLPSDSGAIRVAFASNSGDLFDGHFGSCLRFLVYDASSSDCRLVDIRSAAAADLEDDSSEARVGLIRDCQVVYFVSVGGPAAAKISRAGIYPLKKPEGGRVREILGELQKVIGTAPPPWLAKLQGIQPEKRLQRYRGE